MIEELLDSEIESRLTGPEADPAGFVTWLNSTFPLGAEEKDFDFAAGPEAVKKVALQKSTTPTRSRSSSRTRTRCFRSSAHTLLGSIDRLWQEHLYAMTRCARACTCGRWAAPRATADRL